MAQVIRDPPRSPRAFASLATPGSAPPDSGDIKDRIHADGNMNGQGIVMGMTCAGGRTLSCNYTASQRKH